jgi:hypothetical protein
VACWANVVAEYAWTVIECRSVWQALPLNVGYVPWLSVSVGLSGRPCGMSAGGRWQSHGRGGASIVCRGSQRHGVQERVVQDTASCCWRVPLHWKWSGHTGWGSSDHCPEQGRSAGLESSMGWPQSLSVSWLLLPEGPQGHARGWVRVSVSAWWCVSHGLCACGVLCAIVASSWYCL